MSNEELPVIVPPAPPAVAVGAHDAPGEPSLRENPFAAGKPVPGQERQRGRARRRAGSALAGAGALAAKFAAQLKALLLLAPKLKLLTTGGTALVSIAAYSVIWGWSFAAGLVVLLFVHEMGHVIALRREGIRASAPLFVPFLGAVIGARSLGRNALAEARVGLAGPVLGAVGALGSAGLYLATGNTLFEALAYFGFFLNLFNLLPVVPLDGGRAMAAVAPAMWFVGLLAVVPLIFFLHGSVILPLVLILGGYEAIKRWRLRGTRSLEQAAYYRVSRRNRLLVLMVYVGLVVALAVGMQATYYPRSL